MEYIVSTECKYYGNKKYMVIPRQFVSKDLFMVHKKSDLPKCNYPVRIATDWNQGWGVSNCLPRYDMFGDAYAEIWPQNYSEANQTQQTTAEGFNQKAD